MPADSKASVPFISHQWQQPLFPHNSRLRAPIWIFKNSHCATIGLSFLAYCTCLQGVTVKNKSPSVYYTQNSCVALCVRRVGSQRARAPERGKKKRDGRVRRCKPVFLCESFSPLSSYITTWNSLCYTAGAVSFLSLVKVVVIIIIGFGSPP